MGMIIANENRVRKAARKLQKIFNIRYFLYGGTNRLNNDQSSFMLRWLLVGLIGEA